MVSSSTAVVPIPERLPPLCRRSVVAFVYHDGLWPLHHLIDFETKWGLDPYKTSQSKASFLSSFLMPRADQIPSRAASFPYPQRPSSFSRDPLSIFGMDPPFLPPYTSSPLQQPVYASYSDPGALPTAGVTVHPLPPSSPIAISSDIAMSSNTPAMSGDLHDAPPASFGNLAPEQGQFTFNNPVGPFGDPSMVSFLS